MNFDQWLIHELSPPDRHEDHKFAARIMLLAKLEDQRRTARRAAIAQAILQLIGLATVALALTIFFHSTPVAALGNDRAVWPILLACVTLCCWTAVAAMPSRGHRKMSFR